LEFFQVKPWGQEAVLAKSHHYTHYMQ